MMQKHQHASSKAAHEIAKKRREELLKEIEDKDQAFKEGIRNNPLSEVGNQPSAKRQLMFDQVKKLQAQDLSQREIHRCTGLNRKTVAKYVRYETLPRRAVGRAPKAASFDDYLFKRWAQGERNCRQLWRELKEKGFDGSYNAFFLYMKKHYKKKEKSDRQLPQVQLKIYSARRLGYLLSRDSDKLKDKEAEYLKHLFKHCTQAKLANELALRFKTLLINRQVNSLDPWIVEAIESGTDVLKSFANGLKQDYDAVKNACSMQWSNGQVEGQVNRLKNIKRQMYGRASFELLRKRVLFDSS